MIRTASNPLPYRLVLALPLSLVASFATGPPLAAQGDSGTAWTMRASVAGIYPTGSTVRATLPEGESTMDVSGGLGLGLDLSYRLTRRVSLEASLLVGDLEADFGLETPTGRLADSEDIASETYSVGADFHLTPERRADVYAGALVAMITFDGVTFLTEEGLREKRPFDDDVGFGVQLGVDFPLGSSGRWTIGARLRYLMVIMEAESDSGGRDVELDPFIPSLGIGYRF